VIEWHNDGGYIEVRVPNGTETHQWYVIGRYWRRADTGRWRLWEWGIEWPGTTAPANWHRTTTSDKNDRAVELEPDKVWLDTYAVYVSPVYQSLGGSHACEGG
jgi:hypothetical protein